MLMVNRLKENSYYDLKENFPQILYRLPLDEKKNIGVYGVGIHTQRLFHAYQTYVGPIKANIYFIDSRKQTLTEKFWNCNIYNVCDIGSLPLDVVILSSELYEHEMYQTIRKLYGSKFSIYGFYEKRKEIIFDREESSSIVELPVIRINFADFWTDFNPEHNRIVDILCSRYKVEIADDPDILFCSHFGSYHEEYRDCKKIFVISEVKPFEIKDYDYAIGYPYSDDDRFLHHSVYAPYLSWEIELIQDRSFFAQTSYAQRKFCNFVYSNETKGEGAYIRKRFCMDLGRYKHIDCPGRVLNNMHGGIKDRYDIEWGKSKETFLRQYKFTIAFENNRVDGYTTEKLWQPLRAGSIPIYWGNPLIGRDIDSEALINCNDFDNDFNAVIDRIREVDADDEYYMYMLQKSPLKDSWNPGVEDLKNFIDKIVGNAC